MVWGKDFMENKVRNEESRKYNVITLCGSTKFKNAFMEVQKWLTLQGNIVISVGLFGHYGDDEVWEGMDEDTLTETKKMLDDMHKRKIDMSDEIFVVNVGGYIGDSTRSEIEYAKEHGKKVRYLENEKNSNANDFSKKIQLHINVKNLPISTRLRNILLRSDIEYLEDVSNYPVEMILSFRNMGEATLVELKEICKKYGVTLYERKDLEDEGIPVYFLAEQYKFLFKNGIKCKEDVLLVDNERLADICEKNHALYKKLMQIKERYKPLKDE